MGTGSTRITSSDRQADEADAWTTVDACVRSIGGGRRHAVDRARVLATAWRVDLRSKPAGLTDATQSTAHASLQPYGVPTCGPSRQDWQGDGKSNGWHGPDRAHRYPTGSGRG